MAAKRRHATTYGTYSTYGSVAYAPIYDGNAVRAPRREEEGYQQPAPTPKPREQQHRRALVRTRVQVREAGQVAPFAVIGFLAVAVFAVMVVLSYTQLTVANQEMVTLRRQLSNLQSDNAALMTQYEKIFDMDSFQSAQGDAMVRPSADQMVYIDLSEPDCVVIYDTPGLARTLRSLEQKVEDLLDGIIEYFR